MSSGNYVTPLPPDDADNPNRPTEDALFESVSYYLENYAGRGVPESIIREMHHTLLPGIYDAGMYRQVAVEIEGAVITPAEPHQVGWLMHEALEALQIQLQATPSDDERLDAIIVFFHRFNAIHPFRDGNGRVSRAVLHLLLRQQGLLTALNDFYDVFALRRDEYLEAMKEADLGQVFHLAWIIRIGIADALLKDFLEGPDLIAILHLLPDDVRDWMDATLRSRAPIAEYFNRGLQFIRTCRLIDEEE